MDSIHTLSGLDTADFQRVVDGKETLLHVLRNTSGMEVTVLNYGARIVSLAVPDRDGNPVDVVTGHASVEDYLTTPEPYFGAVCGRYANRIAKGRFVLDGIVYDRLACNNGPNSLHGGVKGFNSVVWDVLERSDSHIVLGYTSVDGEEGFPGELKVTVCYSLKDERFMPDANCLTVFYSARTDRATVVNLTNHAYFNLSGAGDPDIGDHLLRIEADSFLPVDETAIPYGYEAPVDGTPMNFSTPCPIGKHINDDWEQLKFGRGYDHTYILHKDRDIYAPCAYALSPKTGIAMHVYTSEPGIQLYTGNWMTANCIGKRGLRYPARSAFCLETQHFPDSPNRPAFPSVVLRPDGQFESITAFAFSTE